MRLSTITIYLVLLFLLSRCQLGFTQSKSLKFEHLSVVNGLSQNQVLNILQDREGYMWFGTAVGLNKYDGYNFTVFNPDPKNPNNTLKDNHIFNIHEDKKGRLWIGTYGLHLMDKKSGKATPYLADSTRFNYLNINLSVFEDTEGILWISAGGGLNRFDPTSKKFTSYVFPKLVPNFGIVQDGNGTLWIGSEIGLYQFEPKTGLFTPFPLRSDSNPNLPISALLIDEEGVLWIGTSTEGLFRIATNSKPTHAEPYNPGEKINRRINENGLYQDRSGNLWLATTEGLQQIDKKAGQVTTYKADPALPGSLSSNNVLSVYQDRNGTLWVGTDNGINKADAYAKRFSAHQINSTSLAIRHRENVIKTLLEDKEGIIWLGTNNGLYRFHPYNHQMNYVPLTSNNRQINPSDPEHKTSGSTISVLHEDYLGRLWLGTSTGLYLLNRTTGKFKHYPCKIPVSNLDEDPFGKLWIAGGYQKTGSAVMAVFDLQQLTYTYTEYPLNDPAGLKDMYLNSILASRTGDIWVATQSWGLGRMDRTTGKFIYYLLHPQSSNSNLNGRFIWSLYEDKDGMIWAATDQDGLTRLDPKTGKFTYFTTHEGLPSNRVLSIAGDKKGNLWLGTNKGLSRFNTKTKTFRNFNTSDGLLNNEFLHNSVYSGKERLLFGSANGFVFFPADSIKENTLVPPVYLTNLKVLEESRPIPDSVLELSYQENFLSFDFVALNYNAPEKNQYAYQLTGLDKDWVYSGNRRYASYPGLAPGRYTFRVKASNNDGIWNNQGTALTIIIHPPWWRSWWAYTLYCILFLSGVLAIYLYQRQRLIQRERERQRQIELAHAKEIEQAYQELKTTQAQLIQKEKMASLGELTAGIAHEIQNPLNFVNNFSEVNKELITELKQEADKGNITEVKNIADEIEENEEKITHHGKRADAIVKGMLQHSRVSTGEKQLTDINALADEYLRLANQSARTKDKSFNAHIKTHFDPNIGKIDIVPQDIGRVLLNLFNNALYAVCVKQYQMNGTYKPEVSLTTKKENDKVVISVRDNGNGIPQKVIDKIYQPFFTTKPTGEGTGLGLSLSYDIITKGHNGELKVNTKEGEYAEFIVKLPA